MCRFKLLILAALTMPACQAAPAPVAAQAPVVEPAAAAAPTLPRYFSSIVWAVMENHGVKQVKDMPAEQFFIAHGATFEKYRGVTHPSGPNYRAMVSGATWTHNETLDKEKPTVATAIAPLGVPTWVYYMAGAPAFRHDPYRDLHSPVTVKGAVPFDPDALPPSVQVYLGYDDDNDAHDGPLSAVDKNLTALVATLDRSKWFNTPDAHGKYPVLMITWDESYTLANDVLTSFYGHGVKPGFVSPVKRDHYDFCRTLTDNWGVAPLADAAKAHAIDDIWQ